jgi:fructose 1,6-bisphosphate aldolase/phosphatase
MANYLRRQGIFEPHRLPEREMEYTTLPQVLKRLEAKMKGTKPSKKKGK